MADHQHSDDHVEDPDKQERAEDPYGREGGNERMAERDGAEQDQRHAQEQVPGPVDLRELGNRVKERTCELLFFLVEFHRVFSRECGLEFRWVAWERCY